MPGVDPLERGKKLDILLKTLMEAGITQPGLAFLLGVNPDTLSAYLLRASTAGSLYTLPGSDILSTQQSVIELVPRALYTLTADLTFRAVQIVGPRDYNIYLRCGQTEADLEVPILRLMLSIPALWGETGPYLPFLPDSFAMYHINLPTCVLIPFIDSNINWGTANLQVLLFPAPIGL